MSSFDSILQMKAKLDAMPKVVTRIVVHDHADKEQLIKKLRSIDGFVSEYSGQKLVPIGWINGIQIHVDPTKALKGWLSLYYKDELLKAIPHE